jgi:polyether ionophore transport system permease protein
VRATSAVARRAFADARVRTVAFAYLFAALTYANVAGYRSSYPTLADRLSFARSFGNNQAVRLLYGEPHDLLTVGGYTAWRVGGVLVVFAAVWGIFAAVRALRAEEEAGRLELVLSGIVGRRAALGAALVAIGAGATILWVAMFAALVVGRLDVGESAYLALTTVSVAVVFVGVGALASQLAPTRRLALELSLAALALAFALRVVADTSSGVGWLRWATPLGWAEEMRPFTGDRPWVLVLPLLATMGLLVAAHEIWGRRDLGSGLLPAHDTAAPNPRLLGSPTSQALRSELGSLAGWLLGTAAFAFIIGVVSDSVSSAGLSASLRRQLAKVGGGSVATPQGYVAFTFLFFVLAVSLFACAQVAAARREEQGGQLETLLALSVGRVRWLSGRLALGAGGAAAVALAAGLFTWAGGASQGAGLSLPRMLEAGANCLPTALLFLSIAALAFALVPRAATGIAYGLVAVAFLWELFGSLLSAPRWARDLSPFHHVGLVPAQSFKALDAAVMLVIAALAALAAAWLLRRRDLVGG